MRADAETTPTTPPDPRVVSALEWCAGQGIRRLALAAPFPLDPTTLGAARAAAAVEAVVFWPNQGQEPPGDTEGLFQPDEFTWQLPRRCPPTLVFIEGSGALTARMITVALRHRVRTVIVTESGKWRRKSLFGLAVNKLWSKLAAACMKASGPSGGLCQSVLDAVYGRSIAAALSDAPLAFGDRQSAQRVREPQGIVMACPTLVAGGAERQIVNTAIGLHKQGLGPITVLVARLHNPPGNAFFLRPLTEAGVNVREARANESALKRWLDTRALAATTEGARTLALLGRLPQAIRQEVLELGAELSDLNPAVVHCWLDYSNVRAGLAAVCAGVPRVVLSGRNVGPQHFPYIFEPFMRSAYRALLECPNLVLANNSRGGAQDYAEWLRVEPARIPVIYNGLDLALGDPPRPSDVQHLRATLSIPEHAPVVGGMFRFSPEKRPMLWLQVVDRILREQPDCQFVLFGEGNLKARMVAEIRRLSVGDRVRLVPPTQQSRTALAMFDLLLLTSQWEGTPNVAIEAQALRTPVVLTGGGGAKEAIAAGTTGLYVEDAQPANLANAVLTLLSDPPCRKNMAMSGPEFVERRFGIEGMLSRTRRTYQTCDSG